MLKYILFDTTLSRFTLRLCTSLCNHNRIAFEEMSSWTGLTWHIGIYRQQVNIYNKIYQKQYLIMKI